MSDLCPACGTDQEYITANGFVGSHVIMVEVRGVYDGALFLKCPSCDAEWHRWHGDTAFAKRLRRFAEAHWFEKGRREHRNAEGVSFWEVPPV